MPKSDTLEKIRTDTKEIFKPEEPAKYDVIFLNDDITPMEFVIRILKQIFNKTQEEAVQIIDLAINNLKVWFESVPEYDGNASSEITGGAQNYYCHNQQQNPHTPRVMKSLGLNEADVEKFCTDMLFPKLA